MTRPRTGWAFAVLVLVLATGTSVYRDVVPGARTALGFTLFAVEAGGLREPVAHFDGRRWRVPCEDASAPPRESAGREGEVVAIEATRDTPLFPVHELSRDAVHWDAAWRTLATHLRPEVTDEWTRETHVYTVQDRAPSTAFVDVTFREPNLWRGVSVSGWVALAPYGTHLVEVATRHFASYDEFIALDRLAPLGVVQDAVTGARIWVMRTTGRRPEEIRVVELATTARELIRVQRGGCS